MKSILEFIIGLITIIITIPVMLLLFVMLLCIALVIGILSIPILVYEIFTEKND